MINAFFAVNWFAVLAATLAQSVLGGLWYGAVFTKPYAASLDLEGPLPQHPRFIVGPLVCATALSTTSAILLRALQITTYADALAFGALVGVGYLATMTLNIAINPLFPRPFAYALVNAPMFVLGSLLSCSVLTALS